MRALGNAVERKMIEEILFNEKERAQITLDCIADALICTDIAETSPSSIPSPRE